MATTFSILSLQEELLRFCGCYPERCYQTPITSLLVSVECSRDLSGEEQPEVSSQESSVQAL